METEKSWETNVPRDLLLPGIADVKNKNEPVVMDLQFSSDRSTLDMLFWPNQECCMARETPARCVLIARAGWIDGPVREKFGDRAMAAAKNYREWLAK